jgi:outer membrane protein assembly factor BamA
VALVRALGPVSPRAYVGVDTLRGRYFGFGMATPADAVLTTRPVRVDGALGAALSLNSNLQLGGYGAYAFLRDLHTADIDAASNGAEGAIDGHAAGARLELVHDDRDSEFSTRRGGRAVLWAEGWLLQGGQVEPRGRAGASVARFFALYAPDLVLATRLEGGASLGNRAYATSFSLGGADLLRGYLANRFRGDAFLAATLELRFPIWSFVSGVAFADAGRVFRYHDESDLTARPLAVAGGGGLRFGLPPDWLIKLRFDLGFSRDQWGLFFKFNEAF